MKTIKSGIKYNIAYQILIIIVPLITSPYVARTIGVMGIGEYQFKYSIAYYFFLFAMLGVNTYGNREVAKYRDDRKKRSSAFWQIFYIQFFLSIILSAVYIIIGKIFCSSFNNIYIIQVLLILSAAIDINWYAFALEEFKLTTYRSIIIKILSTILIFLYVKTPDDLIIYAIISLGSVIISLLTIIPLVIKTTNFESPNIKEIKKHLKKDFVLFIPSIASSIYMYMDKIMIGLMSTNFEVGHYNYAENITSIPLALTTAIGTVMLPRISNMIEKKENQKVNKYLNLCLVYISSINIAMVFGTIAIADILIPWYLGKNYIYTAQLVKIRSVLIFINGMSIIIRNQLMIPANKDKEYSKTIVIGGFTNLILNLLLIPKYKAIGASIATIISYFIICIIQIKYSKNEIKIKKLLKNIIEFIIVGILILIIIEVINSLIIEKLTTIVVLIIDLILGIIIYLILTINVIKIDYKNILKEV